MGCLEIYIVFFSDTDDSKNTNYFHNTSLCWYLPKMQQHSELEQIFYICQLSIWIVTCYSHRFVEERHKDYYVMYTHHIATIGLVTASWMCGFVQYFVCSLMVFKSR